MKFRALVVAAMVITSVNAGGDDIFMGCFKKGGSRSRSGSSECLVPDDDSDTPQEFRVTGYRGGNDPYDEDASKELADDPAMAYVNPNLTCNLIIVRLYGVWGDADVLDRQLRKLVPAIYKLIQKNANEDDLITQEIEEQFELESKDNLELQTIQEKYAAVMEKYYKTWDDFKRNECSIELHDWMAPEEMIKVGHLLRW
ncbi:hypothetical protein BASA83_001300 [Batrachochytrium salamandrivorans]|nr:hypothetical protein BASA81_013586 [Batrachochytrium salamandrivorans]KAH9276027.1 hypothetical protein BASA83_001300 [Batrachochytrium salamandrivorans]